MKIVLLVDSLHSIAAGSERQIFKLVEGLVASDHQVRLVLLRHTAFTRNSAFTFPCAVTSLDIGSLLSRHAFISLWKLRQQLLGENVDVVHAYFPDACVVAPLFFHSSKLHLITSRRDMGLIYQGKPAWIFWILAHRTNQVISNSSAVSKLVARKEGLKKDQTQVIYNGIESFDFNQPETPEQVFNQADSLKLIFVANIKPVKRTLDAVIALQQLIAKGVKIELTLIGEKQDRDYVAQIENFIDKHQLTHCVHWLGQINEPRRLLNQAHIGLLISESEGLSNTIMEYMQAGLPVIATDVGGNPELITHQHNGLLINKGDIHGLVSAIKTLDDNETLRQDYGVNAQHKIRQQFSIAAMINHHEKVYLRQCE